MNHQETWYYVQDGVSVGPLPRSAMEGLIRSGTIRPETLVSPGGADWVPASSSGLAPLFGSRGWSSFTGVLGRKDWLPKDKRMRTALLIIIVIIGLYAIVSGIQQAQDGTDEIGDRGGGAASVHFMGCQGVSVNAVQCGFVNTGQIKRRLCLDVVVICADGRHVASMCSDQMAPGETSTKLVSSFSPDIQPTVMCSGVTYENMKAKG